MCSCVFEGVVIMANSSSGRVDFWDAEKMLDLYVHDYLVKKNMHSTAAIFRRETDVYSETPVVIDTKDGFLNEWWTLFYDMYSSSTSELKPQEAKAIAPPVQERRENEQQPLQQRKHPRVPEDLPRVPTAVHQSLSRRGLDEVGPGVLTTSPSASATPQEHCSNAGL